MKQKRPIIDLIRGDGTTIEELVHASGIQRRTIEKKLKTLEDLGFIERVYRLPQVIEKIRPSDRTPPILPVGGE